MHSRSQPAFALVGPGRAGTTVAAALVERGWTCVAVAGRSVTEQSTRQASELLTAPAVPVTHAGRDADLVVIATPDDTIAEVAGAIAHDLRHGALVLHLSGACTLAELEKLRVDRPDAELGSLHPLQSLPSVEIGRERLDGSWCAVDGPEAVDDLARSLGMRPFRIDDDQRASYHAAATVASNHLVALLGQASRIAAAAGVPPGALMPLVRGTVDNVESLGAAAALTGPVARGDADTVASHLAALPADEHAAYRAMAAQALRLSGRDDAALHQVLEERDR